MSKLIDLSGVYLAQTILDFAWVVICSTDGGNAQCIA